MYNFNTVHGREKAVVPMRLGSEALKDMPRTYIIHMQYEVMREGVAVLGAELRDVGVEVRREVMDGFPHHFWCFPVENAGKLFRDKLVKGIKLGVWGQ